MYSVYIIKDLYGNIGNWFSLTWIIEQHFRLHLDLVILLVSEVLHRFRLNFLGVGEMNNRCPERQRNFSLKLRSDLSFAQLGQMKETFQSARRVIHLLPCFAR